MRKVITTIMLLVLTVSAWTQYNIGDTVAPADNLSWTIEGPVGNSEVGLSSDIFTKINEGKAVFLFMGQLW